MRPSCSFHWLSAERSGGQTHLSHTPFPPQTHFQLFSGLIIGVLAWLVRDPAAALKHECGNLHLALSQPGPALLGQGPEHHSETKNPFLTEAPAKPAALPGTRTKKTQRFCSHWHFLMKSNFGMKSDFLIKVPSQFSQQGWVYHFCYVTDHWSAGMAEQPPASGTGMLPSPGGHWQTQLLQFSTSAIKTEVSLNWQPACSEHFLCSWAKMIQLLHSLSSQLSGCEFKVVLSVCQATKGPQNNPLVLAVDALIWS